MPEVEREDGSRLASAVRNVVGQRVGEDKAFADPPLSPLPGDIDPSAFRDTQSNVTAQPRIEPPRVRLDLGPGAEH
jgi:hypothetical protein